MFEPLINPLVIQIFSLVGSLAAVLGSVIAASAYQGRQGEKYSLFNHFISELGEIGVSRWAWAFNTGLIICGLLLLPASVGLGLLIPGILSKLGMIAGCIASAAVALVGVYPMNNLTPHTRAAMTYFRFGLVMVLLFTLAIFFQPPGRFVLPLTVGLVGIPAIIAYGFFLLYSRISFHSTGESLGISLENRPAFWTLAFSEWLIFITTIPWFFAVAVAL